jgi:hypothetical protein
VRALFDLLDAVPLEGLVGVGLGLCLVLAVADRVAAGGRL